MTTTKTKMVGVALALACAGALGAGVYVHHAMAEGIPSPTALYYSGVLEEAGAPVDGARDITVTLYANATTTSIACTASAPGTAVVGGHFRVPLPASCTDAIHASPNAHMEVTVAGEALPRVPIGAVPYAVEADHAVSASSADALDSAGVGPGLVSSAGLVTVDPAWVTGQVRSQIRLTGPFTVSYDMIEDGYDAFRSTPTGVSTTNSACFLVEAQASDDNDEDDTWHCRVVDQGGLWVVQGWGDGEDRGPPSGDLRCAARCLEW